MFAKKIAINILYSATALSMLSACSIIDKKDTSKQSNWIVSQFEKDGNENANLATFHYTQGNFVKAEEFVLASLKDNPRNSQALMVGASIYEQVGRPNRARQYYEDIILINDNALTVLGTKDNKPKKMTDVAKERLRLINVSQSEILIEDINGEKVFNISKEGGKKHSKSAIEQALFKKNQSKAIKNQPSTEQDIAAVEILFSDNEQNIINRFLILKELAEKDLITKDEFLSRRMANIGGLLPFTNKPAALGIDLPVPSPEIIVERIAVLKDAVESRAITPREFSAERDLIVEALLSPNPRYRMKRKAPAKDILSAAKNLRKLEILLELNLITNNEKIKEAKSIETSLGINKKAAPKRIIAKKAKPAPVKIVENKVNIVEEVINNNILPSTTVQPISVNEPTPLIPSVSSPFL